MDNTEDIFYSWNQDDNTWEIQDNPFDSALYVNYQRATDNIIRSAGEYVVVANSLPYQNVNSITSFKENISINGPGSILKKDFCYSIDSVTFSEYISLTNENLQSISGPITNMWMKFRYILLSGGPVTINYAYPVYTNVPKDQFAGYIAPSIQDETRVYAYPVTYKSNFLWQPYKLNRAIRLYKDLNLMVNSLFGHEVSYFRVLPQGRSRDVFLFEYSLYTHDAAQCMKFVVPNNEFPDNKLNMGPFGMAYELPFEVQVDKDYFQNIFGEGSGPQKRDVILFPATGRAYEVSSSYLFRDFMNEPLYFKVTLINWNPKSNVDQNDDVDALEEMTVGADKLFSYLMQEEEKAVTNKQQFNIAYKNDDPVRFYVDDNLSIMNNIVMNYYTRISEHQYDLSSIIDAGNVIINIDSSLFEKNVTYYIRLSPLSAQSDIQFFYSMRKMTLIDSYKPGYSIVQFTGGESQLHSNYTIYQLFNPSSQFLICAEEYDNTTNVDIIANCNIAYPTRYIAPSVIYHKHNQFGIDQDRSLMCWFNLQKNANKINRITAFTVNSFSRTINLTLASPEDYLLGDTFNIGKVSNTNFFLFGTVVTPINSTNLIVEIDLEIFEYIDTNFKSWKTFTDLTLQKAFSYTFLNSMNVNKGVKVELFGNRHFKITENSSYVYFSIDYSAPGLETNKWYGLFINMSNTFGQLSLNVWKMQWNPISKIPKTSELKLEYSNIKKLNKIDRTSDSKFILTPSPMYLTNIRWFNGIVESDKQSLILSQAIVKDANMGIIIDNALQQSHNPYVGYTR